LFYHILILMTNSNQDIFPQNNKNIKAGFSLRLSDESLFPLDFDKATPFNINQSLFILIILSKI
ncbi:MAG: hypothetical protein R2549_05150, partial [Candidatus Scalindua sp.]|nr:hypothetical protein [Candidatus Scalindua sp.]